MPRVKALFLVAAAIALAVTLCETPALAAEVTKVDTNDGHVYIDQGKDAGFVFGAEVCFFGPDNKKITCGTVRQSQPTYAMVKVDNKAAKAITKGSRAALQKGKSD